MIRRGEVDEILQLIAQIPEFKNPYAKEEFVKRLSSGESAIFVAESENRLIGFKCGYQRGPETTFYSWMGGVVPEFREKGIALALLREMEDWCRARDYRYLTFKTLNEHKSMLIFALKYGFDIVSVEESPKDDRLRIWLKKQLI